MIFLLYFFFHYWRISFYVIYYDKWKLKMMYATKKTLKILGKAASCGDNMIKIHELSDLKETSSVITLDDERGLENMDWSEDGQLLAVTTSKGNLHVYLSKLPLLSSSSHTRVSSKFSIYKLWISFSVCNYIFFNIAHHSTTNKLVWTIIWL